MLQERPAPGIQERSSITFIILILIISYLFFITNAILTLLHIWNVHVPYNIKGLDYV